MWYEKVKEFEFYGNFPVLVISKRGYDYEFHMFEDDSSLLRVYDKVSREFDKAYYIVTKLNHDIYMSLVDSNSDLYDNHIHFHY